LNLAGLQLLVQLGDVLLKLSNRLCGLLGVLPQKIGLLSLLLHPLCEFGDAGLILLTALFRLLLVRLEVTLRVKRWNWV